MFTLYLSKLHWVTFSFITMNIASNVYFQLCSHPVHLADDTSVQNSLQKSSSAKIYSYLFVLEKYLGFHSCSWMVILIRYLDQIIFHLGLNKSQSSWHVKLCILCCLSCTVLFCYLRNCIFNHKLAVICRHMLMLPSACWSFLLWSDKRVAWVHHVAGK